MKNLIFKILAFFIFGSFLYLVLFFYTFFIVDKNIPRHLKSLEQINFHKKYSNKIHHIRDEYGLNEKFNESKDLLFSNINEVYDNDLTVLFQGDSWMEQITTPHDKNYYSLKILKEYALEKKIKFVNGGTSSFSPSIMSLQLDILEKDFNIFPDIVIAYIDQTDIGDENCRYKRLKKYENGKLKYIRPEYYSHRMWDYTKVYKLITISLSYESKILRTFHKTNFEIKYNLVRFFNKIKIKFNNFFIKEKFTKCHYQTIENYLINPEKKHINYFSKEIENYIDKLKEKKYIKKIFIVTFPQKKHFEKIFKLNVSDIVQETIKNDKTITHINFSKILLENNDFDFKNIWKEDDIHLKNIIHADLFVKKILNELNDFLEFSE